MTNVEKFIKIQKRINDLIEFNINGSNNQEIDRLYSKLGNIENLMTPEEIDLLLETYNWE